MPDISPQQTAEEVCPEDSQERNGPRTAFISSPLDTGPERDHFKKHYIENIKTAIDRGDRFVIGPIPSGVDADALAYLLDRPIDHSRITIYVTHGENALWGDKFHDIGVSVRVRGT